MIYKYFKVNEHSISNLERNELYCQNYKSFNDPFECWFILREGVPNPHLDQERFKDVCEVWGFTPEITEAGLEDYFNYMEEMEMSQPAIQEYVEGAKISCFSKDMNNLLMWSHYADGMRGFCVGFDERLLLSLEEKKEAVIIPVSYSEAPPIIDRIVYALVNDQIWYNETALYEEPNGSYVREHRKDLREAKKLLNKLYTKTIATKPVQWKYEKEVRLIYYSIEDYLKGEFFHYPAEAVKSITVGERMDNKVRETLFQIVESLNSPIEKKVAKRVGRCYKMKFENIV